MACLSPAMAAKRASSAGSSPSGDFESILTFRVLNFAAPRIVYDNAPCGDHPPLRGTDSTRGVRQLLLPPKRAAKGSAGAGPAGFGRADPIIGTAETLAPFIKSTCPLPKLIGASVAGLTRIVLKNCGGAAAFDSGLSVESASGGGGTATATVLSGDGEDGGPERVSS